MTAWFGSWIKAVSIGNCMAREEDNSALHQDHRRRYQAGYKRGKRIDSRHQERRVLMDEQAEIEKYNYSEFVGSEFLPFRTHLPVGSPAPDFQATLLESGRSVQLSEFWKKGDLLVEFGSLT